MDFFSYAAAIRVSVLADSYGSHAPSKFQSDSTSCGVELVRQLEHEVLRRVPASSTPTRTPATPSTPAARAQTEVKASNQSPSNTHENALVLANDTGAAPSATTTTVSIVAVIAADWDVTDAEYGAYVLDVVYVVYGPDGHPYEPWLLDFWMAAHSDKVLH